jgi:hypothetical protein
VRPPRAPLRQEPPERAPQVPGSGRTESSHRQRTRRRRNGSGPAQPAPRGPSCEQPFVQRPRGQPRRRAPIRRKPESARGRPRRSGAGWTILHPASRPPSWTGTRHSRAAGKEAAQPGTPGRRAQATPGSADFELVLVRATARRRRKRPVRAVHRMAASESPGRTPWRRAGRGGHRGPAAHWPEPGAPQSTRSPCQRRSTRPGGRIPQRAEAHSTRQWGFGPDSRRYGTRPTAAPRAQRSRAERRRAREPAPGSGAEPAIRSRGGSCSPRLARLGCRPDRAQPASDRGSGS